MPSNSGLLFRHVLCCNAAQLPERTPRARATLPAGPGVSREVVRSLGQEKVPPLLGLWPSPAAVGPFGASARTPSPRGGGAVEGYRRGVARDRVRRASGAPARGRLTHASFRPDRGRGRGLLA